MGTEKKTLISLDPRTKLLLVLCEAVFVLAVAGGEKMDAFRFVFAVLPLLLLLAGRHWRAFVAGSLVYLTTELVKVFVFPGAQGTLAVLMMILILLISRFLPAWLMGAYVIRTTRVSEFKAAMERMHVPDELTIPMCVMFRFFPTVREEAASIRAAMRMRGIGLGGGRITDMLEYRLVPMLSCSAKIGEELSAAALTRGLGLSRKRTNICHIGFGVWDYAVFLLVIAACAAWIAGAFPFSV